MYFLADKASGVAGSVGDGARTLFPGSGNGFQYAALVKCELEPLANLRFPSKDACFTQQNGIVRVEGENGVGIMHVVGVQILVADQAGWFLGWALGLCPDRHGRNQEE